MGGERLCRSRDNNTGRLNTTIREGIFQTLQIFSQLPSKIKKLCSRARAKTSLRLSKVAVMPVGLLPYCTYVSGI